MIYSKTLYFNKVFCYKLKRYKAKHFNEVDHGKARPAGKF